MADPRQAPFRFWSFFFSLNGRVSRWPFLAFSLITRLAILAARQAWLHQPHPDWRNWALFTSVLGLFTLVVTWPDFALLFKRFHDSGMTGLWALPYFVPFLYAIYFGVASAIALQHHDQAARQGLSLPYAGWILTGINYGLVLVAVLLPESKTTNRFGPRPGYLPDQVQDVF